MVEISQHSLQEICRLKRLYFEHSEMQFFKWNWRQLVISVFGNSEGIWKINVIFKLKQEVTRQWLKSIWEKKNRKVKQTEWTPRNSKGIAEMYMLKYHIITIFKKTWYILHYLTQGHLYKTVINTSFI